MDQGQWLVYWKVQGFEQPVYWYVIETTINETETILNDQQTNIKIPNTLITLIPTPPHLTKNPPKINLTHLHQITPLTLNYPPPITTNQKIHHQHHALKIKKITFTIMGT